MFYFDFIVTSCVGINYFQIGIELTSLQQNSIYVVKAILLLWSLRAVSIVYGTTLKNRLSYEWVGSIYCVGRVDSLN